MKNPNYYFKTFNGFLQFQIDIRILISDTYFRIFRKHIVRRINKQCQGSTNNREFLDNISSELRIPAEIIFTGDERNAVICDAQKTLKGIYNLLGSGDVELNPIQWHTDFKTGYKWNPGTYYKRLNQENIGSGSDVKVPRELSRSHHLLRSGLAYRMTGNEEYARFCINQMQEWIDDNPLMFSINWGCTMDVAIRAVNWIWTLGMINDSKELNSESINKIKCSLYQHGWFIFRNPEKSSTYNGNHYLSDLVGQIHLGLLFHNMKEPSEWLENGKNELFREIRLQILPTGMSFERSTNYNRLVLELVLITILVLKRNNHEIPSDIWYRLEKMFEFIMYSIKPDGDSPIIGDKDNGRLLPLGTESTNNFRYLLSLGAVLFNRTDFKRHGEGFNIYCSILGGEHAFETWNEIPDLTAELKSKAFPDSGLYVMRTRNDYLLFNATGKGKYPEIGPASHTHSDLFSFELFTLGKTFLIDPGTYAYTSDIELRMLYRSTKMHNTVTIDGQSQNIIRKEVLWDFKRNAIPRILHWESNENMDKVTAIHNGYDRLPEPVLHERTVSFDKLNGEWIIKDLIHGKGQHIFEWFFHFNVGIDFVIQGNTANTICSDHKNIAITFPNNPDLILKKEGSYVSKSYGIKEEGLTLVALLKANAPIELEIEISKCQQV